MQVILMIMKKNLVRENNMIEIIFNHLFVLVRIATTEKFGKEFEEF
jgi:hypothetical protein